jgi:hypothetical protein
MSAPFGPFILTLDDITKRMRSTFEGFTDPRKGKNTTYTMVDAALSAFVVFFLQSPSFLEYPRSLEQTRAGGATPGGCSGLTKSPRTTRSAPGSTLPIPPQSSRYFHIFFIVLEQVSVVDLYRSVDGAVLLARDGTGRRIAPHRQAMARTIQPGGTPTAR